MIIVNGKITDDCRIILDGGFNFGRGVFETILVKKEPVFLKQHCKRLRIGLQKLNILNVVDEEYIKRCVKKYGIHDCAMKVVVTERNTVISTRSITYKQEDYLRGFCVKLSNLKRNPFSHLSYLKSLNYTDNLIEKELALAEGYNEVLFLNTQDEIAEGSMSNIFFVKGNKVYTPEINCGILNGIVREWVIKNFEVYEGRYYLEDLYKGDEVFITNSIMGIMKVNSLASEVKYKCNIFYNHIRSEYEKGISMYN